MINILAKLLSYKVQQKGPSLYKSDSPFAINVFV
jgi:hypothetical protein